MNRNHNLNLVVLVGGVVMAIVAIATLFISCKSNYKGVDEDTPVYEIEFEGHTYLEFEGCGIVHDPDCEKCKNI
jgi:hypothetical protein